MICTDNLQKKSVIKCRTMEAHTHIQELPGVHLQVQGSFEPHTGIKGMETDEKPLFLCYPPLCTKKLE